MALCVMLRSVAATLAQPGACASRSCSKVDATVGAGAHLDTWPEPLVSVAGSDHEVRSVMRVVADGEARWVDEVVLGRHGEPGGRLVLHQRVEIDGRALLVHTVRPRTRVTVSAVQVGPPSGPSAVVLEDSVRAGRYALGPTATAWVGLGVDVTAVRAALAALGLHR